MKSFETVLADILDEDLLVLMAMEPQVAVPTDLLLIQLIRVLSKKEKL